MEFTLTSQSFDNNALIPSIYTCDGKNISPPLEWIHAPEGTKSFVLIMYDPDAPMGTWDHWIVYNIPIGTTKLEEGIKEFPVPAKVGVNSWELKGYGGPCPPSGEHRYYFKLYAINSILPLRGGSSKSHVENAMEQHVLDQAVLIGRYERTSNFRFD